MFERDGPTIFELVRQALSSTRRGYDLLAPKFDRTPFRTPDELLEAAFSRVEGQVSAGIDLCTGTGAALPLLHAHCRDRVVGVDFSAGMLAQARARCRLLEEPVVELLQNDVLDLDLDGGFQLACSFGAFGHILEHDEPGFARTVAHLLDRGGRFVFVTSEHPPLLSLQHLIARGFNGIMRLRNMLYDPQFVMYYLTFLLPRCRALLDEAGFDVAVHADVADRPWHHARVVVATKR